MRDDKEIPLGVPERSPTRWTKVGLLLVPDSKQALKARPRHREPKALNLPRQFVGVEIFHKPE